MSQESVSQQSKVSDTALAVRTARSMRCVFIAFGTRGDVQPVAVLSTQYRARNPDALVTFVTHAAHQVRVVARAFLPSQMGFSVVGRRRPSKSFSSV